MIGCAYGFTALWPPVGTAGITDTRSFAFAVAGFVALQPGRFPVWGGVPATAGIGAVCF